MNDLEFLVVDENTYAQKEIVNILKYLAFTRIEQANTVKDALPLLDKRTFDCIISAWEISDISGLDFLRMTRKQQRFEEIPFFLVHSAFTKVKVVQAGRAGVTGLIVMPFDHNNIKKKMSELSKFVSRKDKGKDEKLFEKGLALIEKKKYDEALQVFDKLVKDSEHPEYYYNIGYIKTTQAKYHEAIEAFKKATQLDRMFAKAYEAMGRVFQMMGKKQDAEKCMQQAADIYLSREKEENAEEILNEILEINPDTINVYNSLGVLYRKRGEHQKALEYYLKALKVHPREPHIHYNIGRLYIDLKDLDSAKVYFENAYKIDPRFKEAKEVMNAIELGKF
ncbi:MAG: tetratricopeptide repeat protein [Desulfobacterales bacterium]|nr:tetratricopeptide repeat protein [Desulfobacterales bacterium]